MSTRPLILALFILIASAALAAEPPLPAILSAQLGLPPAFAPAYVPIATSPDNKYTPEQAAENANDILSIAACHVGGNRVLLKTIFAYPPSFGGGNLILYIDLDGNPATGRVDVHHGGTDAQYAFSEGGATIQYYGAFNASNTGFRTAIDGNTLYVAVDSRFLKTDGNIPFGIHLLSERRPGKADSTKHVIVQLPVSATTVPVLPLGKPGGSRPLTDFRYYNDRVMYEKLTDKGLTHEKVAPKTPIQFPRPRPEPTFATKGREPGKQGNVDVRKVNVELLEEAGVARQAAILSFGFPLPKGAVFDPAKIKLVDGAKEVSAQFTTTAFWPDNSLKWVLIDTTVPLKANERRELTVTFGNKVVRSEETKGQGRVAFGGPTSIVAHVSFPGKDLLRFNMPTERFRLFDSVQRGGLLGVWVTSDDKSLASVDAAGARVVDETGKLYTMSGGKPDSVKIEVNGPQKAVIRAEGPYTAADGSTYQRWICRLTFRAGSPLVEAAITQVNDYTKTEFTDITSLDLGLNVPGLKNAAVYGADLKPTPGKSLLQLDDQRLQTDASTSTAQAPGVITWEGGSAIVHDFWQRWPKSLTVTDQGLSFGILPKQPSADYGKDLPYYLMYPFVEGKYRAKWGMAFTTRISFDFTGNLKPAEVYAEAQKPVIAVVPAAYYSETMALGPLAAPLGKQFTMWDNYMDSCFKDNERTRQAMREYGYYNYGDWFGERGRNWGNNEYDLAHGLFMQYARTGDRDMARWARTTAQHRADTDTVWAYPDPYYLGANHQHSIGHSGQWSQDAERATWTHRYDMHTAADSGHVWADGIMDAWFLTGEPRAAESALALAEHCTWAFAPGFEHLGSHERSAGWSLRALLAIYKGTYDPAYLAAAKRIAEVPIREQQFDNGGAWPHVLPKDHAGDTPGASGNNLFLLGVLLGGLQAYHEASGDPAALKSLTVAADWVARSYDPARGGWPYSATTEGRPLYQATTGLNQLIVTPLAYVGRLTGNQRLLEIASGGLTSTVCGSGGGNGKAMSIQAFFTSDVLWELQTWYAKTLKDKGASVLDGSPESMAKLMVATASSERFSVRAPDQKRFFVRLGRDITQLKATRNLHGAMAKRAEFATIKVLSDDGKLVAEGKCSTDDKHEFSFPLVGKGPAQFGVVIDDDQRSVWDLSGEDLQIVTKTVPETRLGGVGRSRFYFMVPPGTKEFKLKLVGAHTGAYGAIVLTPGGKIAESFQGSNPGAPLILGAAGADAPRPKGNPELGEVVVKPAAADSGKIWSVILTAAGDIGVELVGVPPYLALSQDGWFLPKE
ncbi:MAG: RIFT barrel domain-containing protein [Armatimonadota bacterium]